ncbi:ABC transporter permease [Curtobacterium sp. VKM Ac-2884]|uniref:ABC transporter permease n=1 Tax=Curtobacterium sp. VKM Ac-2884 TaxID=2783818 RepID=UPI00188D5000|nr:ABC transporter permease [Curtobacterium sp. VKM Ac-2884]MBF4605578.1 ABC transporter permease [Curtobacterium sp. VKM Ac-2884]
MTAVVPGAVETDALAGRPPASTTTGTARVTRRGWRGLLRRPTFLVSVAILLGWVVLAVGWHLLGLQPFARTGELLQAPSAAHWFGTDSLGRDVFARVAAGARPALVIGPFGAALATVVGGTLGLLAGYHRGWVDTALMRFFDVLLALPSLIFLVVLVGAFGVSTPALVLIVGVLFAPGIARIVRAAVLVEMGKSYVQAARLQGESAVRAMVTELLPNVIGVFVIQAVLSLGAAIFITASLSFLGLGSQPPAADWGLDINANRAYLQAAWWTVVFPGVAVASIVVSANLIADNLKEVSE